MIKSNLILAAVVMSSAGVFGAMGTGSLTSSTRELSGGMIYTVNDDVTINGDAGASALTVKSAGSGEGSIVVIDIQNGHVLTVNGGNANGQTGAGAGILLPEGADRTPRLISAFQSGPICRKRRGDRDIPDWLVCSDWHGERGPILPCVLSAEQAGCDQTLSAAWRARTRACACVCALARHVRPRACVSRTDAAGRGAAPGSARTGVSPRLVGLAKSDRILARYFIN